MKQPYNRIASLMQRPAVIPTPVSVEAPPMLISDTVLPHVCPECGQGQTPKIIGKRPNGERDVRCNQCGRTYIYDPAKVRKKIR